ncbi:hypothetical protein [Acuticoccus sp.]|uniref:hypothetical protein n=1 Tax=Acuticoccus sp. TaxID=1904378 RepID=UPI003B520921
MRLVRCGTVIGVAAAIDHTAAVQLHVERWSPMMPQITADRPALRYTLAHFD